MKRQAPDPVVSAPRPVEAAMEWAANVVPGITSIPSGIWEVNRAREAGYTYFAAADDYGLESGYATNLVRRCFDPVWGPGCMTLP
jgi:hypothetical protein